MLIQRCHHWQGVLQKELTILNDIVDTEGVTFNIANNYGYAVLKIS